MSLFVDVIPALSDKIKSQFFNIIEKEKNNHDRPVRKICDVCTKYLDYGELRYDKMEDGISVLEDKSSHDVFYDLLLGVLHESLDEDQDALNHLTTFSASAMAQPIRKELDDFITIGRFVTLKEFDQLENAGLILVDWYTDEENVAETITNLYFQAEAQEYLPVFQKLIARAKELHPESMHVDSAGGYISMMGKDYSGALKSFEAVRLKLEENTESSVYHLNLASIWNSIAGCHLKMGDASKALECCDTAFSFDEKTDDSLIRNTILYNKAEALLLLAEKDQALIVINQLLAEDKEDEKALEMIKRINA